MQQVLFALLAALLATVSTAGAFDVLVVEGARLRPYEEAVEAFRHELEEGAPSAGPMKALPSPPHRICLSQEGSAEELHATLHTRRPDLILAVGTTALEALSPVRDIPIVFVLVPPPGPGGADAANVTGVTMEIPADRWLAALASALPGARRVGLVYHPPTTGAFVAEAEEYAGARGLTLAAEPVDGPQQVPAALGRLRGRIDAYWMLPDLNVVTPQTAESILLFSLDSRVPVLTFSEKYLERGAALALSFDIAAMGTQAGRLAERILAGTPPARLPPEPARGLRLKVNRTVAQKLGLPTLSEGAAP